MEVKEKWPLVLKILLGLVFIVSAILKIAELDQFEVYVFSYRFFGLNFSFLVARVAIIIELILGIGLISNCFHKLMWWGSVAMLAVYTLLLVYAQMIGRTDSCHCFGDFLPLNPWQSILKNVVLLGLFALVYKVKGFSFKGQRLALAGLAVAATVAVFALSPPDNYTSNYRPEKILNEVLFKEMISNPPLDTCYLNEGKQVVCLFSTSCELCQLAARKLAVMQRRDGFPPERITFVFMGSEEGVKAFCEQTETVYRSVLYEDVKGLLKVNDGKFPTLAFLEQGTLVHEYGLRNMKEMEIKAFFTQNDYK